jgi:hypothetical protein
MIQSNPINFSGNIKNYKNKEAWINSARAREVDLQGQIHLFNSQRRSSTSTCREKT